MTGSRTAAASLMRLRRNQAGCGGSHTKSIIAAAVPERHTEQEGLSKCAAQGRVYTINHRRDAAATKSKRRVAPEDDEEDAMDNTEALPPQVLDAGSCSSLMPGMSIPEWQAECTAP